MSLPTTFLLSYPCSTCDNYDVSINLLLSSQCTGDDQSPLLKRSQSAVCCGSAMTAVLLMSHTHPVVFTVNRPIRACNQFNGLFSLLTWVSWWSPKELPENHQRLPDRCIFKAEC